MNCAVYTKRPIQSVSSLCCALGCTENYLLSVAGRIPKLYIGPLPIPKKNGEGVRYVYDTKSPLKPLLKKVNEVFFRQVRFPNYLHGSLSGRDFISNVEAHAHSIIVITEDIAQFFDCITDEHVYKIWTKLFGFAPEPSSILTTLTTNIDQSNKLRVFQGTPTSSYLANLVFWDIESKVVEKLAARRIRYSRYVDDITLSSPQRISRENVCWAISQIYAMMGSKGFKPKRSKHTLQTAKSPISIMGLNANRQPTLSKTERSGIRANVYQLEQAFEQDEIDLEFLRNMNRARGKIGRLGRLHLDEAVALKERLKTVQRAVDALPFITAPVKLIDNENNLESPPF